MLSQVQPPQTQMPPTIILLLLNKVPHQYVITYRYKLSPHTAIIKLTHSLTNLNHNHQHLKNIYYKSKKVNWKLITHTRLSWYLSVKYYICSIQYVSAKPIIKKCSFQRFPLRERSGVKATRPSPNGQLLLRKTSFQFDSCHHFVIWPFHSCTSQCCLMIKLFCQSSLLSQICHRHDRCLVIPSRHTMQKIAIRP